MRPYSALSHLECARCGIVHDATVVQGLCDIITVLTRGRVLAEGDYASVSRNPDVIAAYLGSEESAVAHA